MPPPPPPPPPLPSAPSLPEKVSSDRNALLHEIQLGTKLKKTVTNDKSAPIIGNSQSRTSDGSGIPIKGNGPQKIQLGGLFSEGVPKLRHVGNKFGSNRETGGISSNMQSDVNHKQCANSYPSSPISFHKNTFEAASSNISKPNNCASGITKRSFPNDITAKGPAPPPPPSINLKPNFETDLGANKLGPPLPNKPPGITRSSSHCQNAGRGARFSKSAPNVKPPPPPKSPLLLANEPPALPSKPPSLVRRLSYGAHDNRNGAVLQHGNSDAKLNSYKNFSVSSNQSCHQISPIHNQLSSMNKNPSPAPPSRTGGITSRPPNVKPPPPPLRMTTVGSSPAPPTTAPPPPPPPPHHYRVNSFQTKPSSSLASNNNLGQALPPPPPPPPPPTRVASAKSTHVPGKQIISNFESRFKDKFHNIPEFTLPEYFTSRTKLYPSKMVQSHRRQPAPPPPGMPNGTSASQPKIHIQLESRLFSNNVAEC